MTVQDPQQKAKTYQVVKWTWFCIIAVSSIMFAPGAIQYPASVTSDVEPWMYEFYVPFTSRSYQFNLSSHSVQRDYYRTITFAISWHAIAGGLWLISGILQFFSPLRQKYPTFHRINGYIYSLFVIISLVGSFNLLFRAGNDMTYKTYSGPLFKWLLIGYWLAGLMSFTVGIGFAIFQRIHIHRQFMIVSYSMASGAVFLRWAWVLFYWIDTDSSMDENNISATITMLAMMTICLHLTISYGDTENVRNLKRFFNHRREIQMEKESQMMVETAKSRSVSASEETKVPIPMETGTDTVKQQQETSQHGEISKLAIGVTMGLVVTSVVFGLILPFYWMSGDNFDGIWFDNKSYEDSNVALRVLHILSWFLMSLIGITILLMYYFSNDFGFLKILKSKYEKQAILLWIIVSLIGGIITLIYVSTFERNEDRYIRDSSAIAWVLNVFTQWLFLGLFYVYYYVYNDFDRGYEALMRVTWNSSSLTVMTVLVIVLGWFEITANNNELLACACCMNIEMLYLLPILSIAFSSDMTVKNGNVGKARWPWNKCVDKE